MEEGYVAKVVALAGRFHRRQRGSSMTIVYRTINFQRHGIEVYVSAPQPAVRKEPEGLSSGRNWSDITLRKAVPTPTM